MLARPCGSEKVRMLGARLRTTGRWYWPPPSRAQMLGGACRVQPLHRLRKRLVVARSWLGKCAEVVGTSHQRLESRSVYALRATFIDESATTENGRSRPSAYPCAGSPGAEATSHSSHSALRNVVQTQLAEFLANRCLTIRAQSNRARFHTPILRSAHTHLVLLGHRRSQ